MQPSYPTAETQTVTTNRGYMTRWKLGTSKEVLLLGGLLTAGCQVADQIDESTIELLSEQECRFKNCFQVFGRPITGQTRKAKTSFITGSQFDTEEGSLARCNLTSVDLRTFIFSAGSKSLSIDNAVVDPIQKRLLFTMITNTDFYGSLECNPYKFQHYNISDFSLSVNGKQFPNESLSLGMDHEKTSVMG